MGLIQFIRDFLTWLKYRNAVIVNSRDELAAALQLMPPRIVVDGDEALRAYAATIAEPDAEKWAQMQAATPTPTPGAPPVYMQVPKIGRIRDGYRKTRKPPQAKRQRMRLKGGMDSVVVAVVGITAALLMEWLSFPDMAPRMVRGPHRPGMPAPVEAAPIWQVSDMLVSLAIPLLD